MLSATKMLKIYKLKDTPTVGYAADELKKYLSMMMPEGGDIEISYDPEAKDGFRLGLMQDFGLDVSDARDAEQDDIVYIDCDERGGLILGDNIRSILLAVYEYLRQNGCRWLFPGVDGEFIPTKDIIPVKHRHKASMKYRGQCIEGAIYQQALLDAIDFMPKVGMNTFMSQFFNPHTFYNRWHEHQFNETNRISEKVSEAQVMRWKAQVEAEISRRGMLFHDVGHGWTACPFGIRISGGWVAIEESEFPTENKQYLAEIGGRRGLFNKKPYNTNFCMSNPVARRMVTDYVCDFAEKHRSVTHLHLWLSDGSNNHCECRECVKSTPSDLYVKLLNELDESLSERGLDTRIVFISYVDTTWAPLRERIKNEERFTLLFAPYYRSYAYSVPEDRPKAELPPYKRNDNKLPGTLGDCIDFLDQWKKVWGGPIIGYEYHFWRHQFYDLSGLHLPKLLNTDVKVYESNSIDGIISCGSQRSFFPMGLAFYSFARSMYDTSLSYEEIEEDYFTHAFGEKAEKIKDYLLSVAEAIPFEDIYRMEQDALPPVSNDEARAARASKIREITKGNRELLRSAVDPDFRVRTVSGELLLHHADLLDMISDWYSLNLRGEYERGEELHRYMTEEFGKREALLDRYFEHFLCLREYGHKQRQFNAVKSTQEI